MYVTDATTVKKQLKFHFQNALKDVVNTRLQLIQVTYFNCIF